MFGTQRSKLAQRYVIAPIIPRICVKNCNVVFRSWILYKTLAFPPVRKT